MTTDKKGLYCRSVDSIPNENKDLVPFVDFNYYCLTCGSMLNHPETSCCFMCDSDNWESFVDETEMNHNSLEISKEEWDSNKDELIKKYRIELAKLMLIKNNIFPTSANR